MDDNFIWFLFSLCNGSWNYGNNFIMAVWLRSKLQIGIIKIYIYSNDNTFVFLLLHDCIAGCATAASTTHPYPLVRLPNSNIAWEHNTIYHSIYNCGAICNCNMRAKAKSAPGLVDTVTQHPVSNIVVWSFCEVTNFVCTSYKRPLCVGE